MGGEAPRLFVPNRVNIRWDILEDGRMDLTYREHFAYLPEDIFEIVVPQSLEAVGKAFSKFLVSKKLLPDGLSVHLRGDPMPLVICVLGELMMTAIKNTNDTRKFILSVHRIIQTVNWEKLVRQEDRKLFDEIRKKAKR
ncbi:MAG: hypothetical protein ACE5OY_00175 [Candidatus Bathyarchaeia archaeon]